MEGAFYCPAGLENQQVYNRQLAGAAEQLCDPCHQPVLSVVISPFKNFVDLLVKHSLHTIT